MMLAKFSSILLAQVPSVEDVIARWGQGVRGERTQTGSNHLTVALFCVVAILLVWFILTRMESRRKHSRSINSPFRLFLALGRVHRLGWLDLWLLWRLARQHHLPTASVVFVDPDQFAPSASRFAALHQGRLQVLRERLFDDVQVDSSNDEDSRG